MPAQKITVLSGPSGVGKGTIIRRVRVSCPDLTWSVSATTRKQRPGERHGFDYHFLTEEEFDRWVREGRMLEWAVFAGVRYGTPRPEPNISHLLVENDIQGAPKIRVAYPKTTLLIWIDPPGRTLEEKLAVLERRLQSRGTEGAKKISERLEIARHELEIGPKIYDRVVVNHDHMWRLAARQIVHEIRRQ